MADGSVWSLRSRRQLALLEEQCLEIVPGSHRRWRSEHENAVLRKSAGTRTPLTDTQP